MYEAILQYNIDGELLQWAKNYYLAPLFTPKESERFIKNLIKIEYPIFEIIKITKL